MAVGEQELMPRSEGWSRWSREHVRITAVEAVLRTKNQKGSRKIEDDGKARRNMSMGI